MGWVFVRIHVVRNFILPRCARPDRKESGEARTPHLISMCPNDEDDNEDSNIGVDDNEDNTN